MSVAQGDCEKFVNWLLEEAVAGARGDRFTTMRGAPGSRLWLGRIASQAKVEAERDRLGDRGEPLAPGESGFRVRLSACDRRHIQCRVSAIAWRQLPASQDPDAHRWAKTEPISVEVDLSTPTGTGDVRVAGRAMIADAFQRVGAASLAAEVRAEVELGKDGRELVVTLVNVSPEEAPDLDTNIYEACLDVQVGETAPFVLEGLSDSFRYDRNVPAYGVNGGLRSTGNGVFITTDYAIFSRRRPVFWDEEVAGPQPDLTFESLAREPLASLRDLVSRLEAWIDRMWSEDELRRRSRDEQWSDETLRFAMSEGNKAREEALRTRRGLE